VETDFINWLTSELNQKGWTNSELARRANVVPSTVSTILSGQKKPGKTFCAGVARAFGLPVDQVMRLAGLLPSLPLPDNDPTLKELYEIGRQLTGAERKRLLNVALLYLREQQAAYFAGGSTDQDSTAKATT